MLCGIVQSIVESAGLQYEHGLAGEPEPRFDGTLLNRSYTLILDFPAIRLKEIHFCTTSIHNKGKSPLPGHSPKHGIFQATGKEGKLRVLLTLFPGQNRREHQPSTSPAVMSLCVEAQLNSRKRQLFGSEDNAESNRPIGPYYLAKKQPSFLPDYVEIPVLHQRYLHTHDHHSSVHKSQDKKNRP
ncbi:hypothetical protein STEG23_028091, partial [Scotinomys teguina]